MSKPGSAGSSGQTAQDAQIARRGRLVALIIAGTMLLWLAAQWIAPSLGLPGRYALLFDLAALAALFYAMVNIYQIWRVRRESQG